MKAVPSGCVAARWNKAFIGVIAQPRVRLSGRWSLQRRSLQTRLTLLEVGTSCAYDALASVPERTVAWRARRCRRWSGNWHSRASDDAGPSVLRRFRPRCLREAETQPASPRLQITFCDLADYDRRTPRLRLRAARRVVAEGRRSPPFAFRRDFKVIVIPSYRTSLLIDV